MSIQQGLSPQEPQPVGKQTAGSIWVGMGGRSSLCLVQQRKKGLLLVPIDARCNPHHVPACVLCPKAPKPPSAPSHHFTLPTCSCSSAMRLQPSRLQSEAEMTPREVVAACCAFARCTWDRRANDRS